MVNLYVPLPDNKNNLKIEIPQENNLHSNAFTKVSSVSAIIAVVGLIFEQYSVLLVASTIAINSAIAAIAIWRVEKLFKEKNEVPKTPKSMPLISFERYTELTNENASLKKQLAKYQSQEPL